MCQMIRSSLIWQLCFVVIVGLMINTASAQSVLMLVAPGAGWHVDVDLELADLLEADGYDVTVQAVDEVPGEEQADLAEEFDVVYIADSLGSTSVHDGVDIYLKESPVPVIAQEAYMWDEAQLTGRLIYEDFGDTFQAVEESVLGAFTELDIVNPNHPMAAGLSGAVSVYTDPYGYNYGYVPEMGTDVDVIATIPGQPEYATLFVYDQGDALAEEFVTPGMRIGVFLGQNVVSEDFGGDGTNNRWDRLTEDGVALFKAAFGYASGRLTAGPTGDYNGSGDLDAGDLDVHAEYVRSGDPAGDVNGDGSTNLADRLAWVKDLQGSWVGDSNFDGEFNSGDFVTVFTSGKYEQGPTATYSEGDWNGDSQFDSTDFVTVFSAGGYEQGPRAIAVPEPSTWALLLVAALVSLAVRRSPKNI